MLYIGNQTAWAAKPTEPFDYALEQHFDAFEWFPDKKPGAGWDESDLDTRARESIRETGRTRGVRLSVHARWQANPTAADGNWLLGNDIELARDLGAVLLNIHLFHEQGVAAFVEAILPLIQRTAKLGLKLAIENTPHHSPEDFNELFAQLRALDSADARQVGMCLDIGHANLCSATLNDYLGFFDRLDPQVPIIHLHLHENWGDADSHLPLFTGPAGRDDSGIRGLLDRLRTREFSGAAILEQWPNPPSLLDQARERLLKLWQSNREKPVQHRKPGSASPSQAPEPEPQPRICGPGLIGELSVGDRLARSWREKLELARSVLARDTPPIGTDELVDIAIYLRFLGTGEIACEEDGRHFRPAHHARIAEQIRQKLAGFGNEENAFIVRKLYPWLPSSAADFRRPEPLTRIRDIAHRNDIDPELKREIKTALQNKLHRCAGPEDLQTSSALLARITAPGANYSPAFVEQFRIFHEELKEFFNAQSLEERLKALEAASDAKRSELIRLFLRQKASAGLAERLASFRTLTALREVLLEGTAANPSRNNPDFLLADIALEDFAFALLSELINLCETARPEQANDIRSETLILALKNLELSAIDRPESRAVGNELRQWGKVSLSASRDEVLRFKACLLRCRRLAEDFGGKIVALFSRRVEELGRALGVAQPAIRVFCESDLRGHLVFQVSKLVSALLRQVREQLGAPAWDVLVTGRAVGRLAALASLDRLARDLTEPAVLLLNNAAGDEEIPGNVRGIVLGHELPHLSHLSVRARQAGVVFVTCEEAAEYERLHKLEGQRISLTALPDAVAWEAATGSAELQANDERSSLTTPRARLSLRSPWIPIEQATIETSGGKADGVRRLAEISQREGSAFHTPPGLVIPFGVMEAALAEALDLGGIYNQLLKNLDGKGNEIASVSQHLQEIIHQLSVPEPIIMEVAQRFGREAALIVRSSANCEDLEQFAGAGLYQSVINISPADLASGIRAVWASLWTERATLSRREAGIPHQQAHMAVLIQELLDPELSFILHTVNPLTRNEQEVYAEIVIGLGETLVSAASRGTPYRLACDKHSGSVVALAFANFSQAARSNHGGGVRHETLDYSEVGLSRETAARQNLGRRLAVVGSFVEQNLGKPQDIEGAIVRDRLYLVQARPQQGLLAAPSAVALNLLGNPL